MLGASDGTDSDDPPHGQRDGVAHGQTHQRDKLADGSTTTEQVLGMPRLDGKRDR